MDGGGQGKDEKERKSGGQGSEGKGIKAKKIKGGGGRDCSEGSGAGVWRRREKGGRRWGRRPARRPQGLLGRGQPISLSLINSSRGDCNTAGDCWGKKKKRWKERGRRGQIGMNGKVWRGGAGGVAQLVDEEKIGKEGKRRGDEGEAAWREEEEEEEGRKTDWRR